MTERRLCRKETDLVMKGMNSFEMDRTARILSFSRHIDRFENGRRYAEREDKTSPTLEEDSIRDNM